VVKLVCAVVAYEWMGLAILRKAWLNGAGHVRGHASVNRREPDARPAKPTMREELLPSPRGTCGGDIIPLDVL